MIVNCVCVLCLLSSFFLPLWVWLCIAIDRYGWSRTIHHPSSVVRLIECGSCFVHGQWEGRHRRRSILQFRQSKPMQTKRVELQQSHTYTHTASIDIMHCSLARTLGRFPQIDCEKKTTKSAHAMCSSSSEMAMAITASSSSFSSF